MYVCMFTYINIHTPPPSPSSSHLYTRIHTCRLPETARGNILDLKGRTWELGKVGGCNTSNLIFRISEGRTSPPSSITTRRGAFSSAHITRPSPPTRIDFYTHTYIHPTYTHIYIHTPIPMRRQWKTCMYKRAITRACKSRNYNASRSERSCHSSVSSLPFPSVAPNEKI